MIAEMNHNDTSGLGTLEIGRPCGDGPETLVLHGDRNDCGDGRDHSPMVYGGGVAVYRSRRHKLHTVPGSGSCFVVYRDGSIDFESETCRPVEQRRRRSRRRSMRPRSEEGERVRERN